MNCSSSGRSTIEQSVHAVTLNQRRGYAEENRSAQVSGTLYSPVNKSVDRRWRVRYDHGPVRSRQVNAASVSGMLEGTWTGEYHFGGSLFTIERSSAE